MYAPLPAAVTPARILVLSRGESSVRIDMALLRAIGARGIVHHTRMEEAVDLLLACEETAEKPARPHPDRRPFDVVLCDAEFEDGSAVDFLLRLADNPFLNSQPVLVVAGGPGQAAALGQARISCLERPYTQKQMSDALAKAMSPMRPKLAAYLLAAAKPARHPACSRPRMDGAGKAGTVTTSDWMRKGMASLRGNDPRAAEAAFLRVLDRQDDHPEASLALAQIRLAREEGREARHMLLRAAAGCLRRGEKERAESIAALLPAHMRGDKLFVHEAQARMEEGEFRAAALSFLEARRENPETPLHSLLARAAALTPDPEDTLRNMCDAYERMGHKATAGGLRKRLLHNSMADEEEGPHWLDKFPALQEIVRVAAYTAHVWRHA